MAQPVLFKLSTDSGGIKMYTGGEAEKQNY